MRGERAENLQEGPQETLRKSQDPMTPGKSRAVAFGPFVLDVSRRVLLRNGEPVALQPKAFDMLLLLVERRDVVLTKDELFHELWPDTFVDEANLSQNIYVLRKALGQEGPEGYIRTVPKRGYRFIADVHEPNGAADPSSLARDDATSLGKVRRASILSAAARRSLAFVAAGVVLCALASIGYLRVVRQRATPQTVPRNIAVLPFKRLSPPAGDEYLGVGLCDVLVTQLSRLQHLVVRPTSAVMKYDAPGIDTVAAGRELRAEAVLEGSLQRDGDRLRLTVRLINVEDGATIWAQTFDEPFEDLFQVQDAIASDVVRELAIALGQDDRAVLARHYTRNVDAYHLYLKGRYFWEKRTEASTRKSIEAFEQAVSRDPEYALAYTGLADAYWTLHFLAPSSEPEDLLSRAKAAAMKALTLDDTLAEAHTSLGAIRQVYDVDFAAAESEYKRALALNPNYAVGHQRYGFLLNSVGRVEEAEAEFRRALALDPLSPVINTDAARPLIHSRNYQRALEQLRAALEIDPNFPRAHNLTAYCYTELGQYDEAAAEAQRAAELSGPPGRSEDGSSRLSYQLAYIYARAGRDGDARRVLDELEPSASRRNDQLVWHALTYVALGDRDRAFVFIEKLYETRSIDLATLKTNHEWDGLRDDSRFRAVLLRSGLTR